MSTALLADSGQGTDTLGALPEAIRSARTFPALIRAAAAIYGDEVAITLSGDAIADESASFADLDRQSAELARGLLARGVGKGARVGFIFGNGPQFAIVLAAIARIGAIAVPISTLIKANELVRVLRQSDVGGLITQRTLLGHDYVQRLCDAIPQLRDAAEAELYLEELPYLRWIVASGEGLPASMHDRRWLVDHADRVSEAMLRAAEAEVHTTDQMVEIYTSGSMALPKGVKHLHGPVMARAHYLATMSERQRGHAYPATLPMFWVGGLGLSLLAGWSSGAVTTCTEGTSTNSRMAMGSVLADEDLALMALAKPYWGLGMSETFGPYSYGDVLRVPGYPLCAPLDHVAEGYELRVANADGTPVADGETGEIQVRGYALAPGLHKLERDAYFTPDGFYHTGDLGLVEGPRVHFVGRDVDMIKTAGSNVSPAEVELELQQFDGIETAYVVGLPDADRGQLVVAAVVPKEGAELNFEAIQAELRKRLSSYKVPRAYVAITRDEVPMLHSNKVSRRQVEALMAERLGKSA